MNRKWSFLTTVLLFSCAQLVLGQDWVIPDAESNVSNPSPYILENVDAGKDLYNLNCKSCHGDPGKNNPLALVPTPVDVASDRMHLNTEGALYYKITKGRGIMPPFEGSISEENRWKLVNFIMNFKPGGEMILVDAPPIKAKLLASVNEQNSTVEILAESEEENSTYASLVNTPVIISSKRAFGNIEIGKAVTNENGRAEYRIPENSIGDEEGFMSIVVSLNDEYEAEVVYLDKARVGKMKEVPKLIKDEVLWSTNDNVSLWLLFSYLLFAGGAWAVIAYVVYQLVKVRRYSKQ
jgi:cytochrome c5